MANATPPPVGDRAPQLPPVGRLPGESAASARNRTDVSDAILSWGWFLIVIIVAAQLPAPLPRFVRMTLVLILAYLALTNTSKLERLSRRFVGGLT